MDFLFNSSEVIPLIQLARKHKKPILFIRYVGVFLMVQGNNEISCFAKGCNPNFDMPSINHCDGHNLISSFDPDIEIFNHVLNLQLNLKISTDKDDIILSAVKAE